MGWIKPLSNELKLLQSLALFQYSFSWLKIYTTGFKKFLKKVLCLGVILKSKQNFTWVWNLTSFDLMQSSWDAVNTVLQTSQSYKSSTQQTSKVSACHSENTFLQALSFQVDPFLRWTIIVHINWCHLIMIKFTVKPQAFNNINLIK